MKKRKKIEKYPEGYFVGLWMSIGIALGVVIGVAIDLIIGNSGFFGIGLLIGLVIGIIIGALVEKNYKKQGKIRPLNKKEKKGKNRAIILGLIILLIGVAALVLTLSLM
ncbi:MAG: hypothetical protein ABIH37_01395 [archaeon]